MLPLSLARYTWPSARLPLSVYLYGGGVAVHTEQASYTRNTQSVCVCDWSDSNGCDWSDNIVVT